MADPESITVTVTVTDFNDDDPKQPTATFTYSGDGIDGNTINPKTGVVSVYTFTPAPDSPWTEAPLTAWPAADWLRIEGWTITIDGTLLGKGASAGFRLSVVLDKVTYVNDPTIIMVDPPMEYRKHKAV